jgi:flagellar biosynthesis protein FliQ
VAISLEPLREFMIELGQFLPRLALALVVLVGGWLIAKALRYATVRMLRAVNFHVVTDKAGVDQALRQGGVQHDTAGIVALLIYWIVLILALMVGFNTLGLSDVTTLLRQVLLWVPKLIVSILVLAFGAYFARFLGNTVESYCWRAQVREARVLGRLTFYVVLTFFVLWALARLDIAGSLVQASFLILLSGLVLALSIAFGLGGRKRAEQLLQRWGSSSATPPPAVAEIKRRAPPAARAATGQPPVGFSAPPTAQEPHTEDSNSIG